MKRRAIKAIALGIAVGAPAAATISQFPLWIERSAGSTVSGLVVLFLLLSSIPLMRYYKRILKSPSAPLMWGILFGLLSALHTIIEEMLVISFVGFVANVIGWGLFKIAGKEETES